MKKLVCIVLLAVFVLGALLVSRIAQTAPDPYAGLKSGVAGLVFYDVTGKTLRSPALNTGEKTLVLIMAGQSNLQNIGPTTNSPVNAAKIDNMNIVDGRLYAAVEPLVGTGWPAAAPFGKGNVATRIADTLITNGKFGRVIIVPIAIGATSISQWDTTGELAERIPDAVKRMIDCGITPARPNVTFALVWGQGEGDDVATQAAYQAALARIIAHAQAAGFVGRFFINKETWAAGVVNPAVQEAQWGVVDNVTVFRGFDADSLNSTFRQPSDNGHFIDSGQAAFAAGVVSAMAASGAPF